MIKYEQELANKEVILAMESALGELFKESGVKSVKGKRLRGCTAWVFETEGFYILKSYETYIACIRKYDDVLFDALRLVYGYTSTSAQHIAKFGQDYGQDKWGVHEKVVGR